MWRGSVGKRNTGINRLIDLKVAIVIATTFATAPAVSGDQPLGENFFDDFLQFSPSRWGVSDGWVNGDWQNCEWSRDAVRFKSGQVELKYSARSTDKRDFICGEIQTREYFGFGTYEARLRTAKGSGLNAAFFTYTGPPHGNPHDEIDFEVLTRDTSRVSLNTYVSGEPKNGKSVALPVPSDSEFITYSFIWEKHRIRWFVDHVLVHETAPGGPIPVTPQKIYASFWGSESFPNWMGDFVEPAGELTMEIEWLAYTRIDEICQFQASVLCALQ